MKTVILAVVLMLWAGAAYAESGADVFFGKYNRAATCTTTGGNTFCS